VRSLEAWESGRAAPKPGRLTPVAEVLDVDVGWILTGELSTARRIDDVERAVDRLTGALGPGIAQIAEAVGPLLSALARQQEERIMRLEEAVRRRELRVAELERQVAELRSVCPGVHDEAKVRRLRH
jgi:transcriptional regulator with XRE-family HTH domain